MNETEDNTGRPVIASPIFTAGDFEEALSTVEEALRSGEVDRALDMLSVLQIRFVRASKLFDLKGDALLKKGLQDAGRRYKRLYEALRNTLRVVAGEAGSIDFSDEITGAIAVSGPVEDVTPEVDAHEIAPPLPITEAMADELLRQGRPELARGILDALREERPDDEALSVKAEAVRKRIRSRKKAALLEGWLSNLAKLKSGS